MRIHLLCAVSLFFGGWAGSVADSTDWRLTTASTVMSDVDKNLIGRVVCGEVGYEATGIGVRCNICPKFTGNAGSDEGLEILHMIRGHFSAAKAESEWMLDTDGCEAHFESFGGAIMLGPADLKPLLGAPAVAPGSGLTAKPAAGSLAVVFYRPGYRLNDCLAFGGDNARTLLVCNETDMAQGEVIGHISAVEISRRGITRWRLLRWYDNSAADTLEVVSIVPTGMRRVEPDNGQPALQVNMKFVEATRDAYEKDPESPGKTINLVFRRQDQRFFATGETQAHLEAIGNLTRRILE